MKKAPRRTAERILEVALDLCNRFGMPNVSTTQIASEMRISPGNLYYHYASKDDLINTLFDRHEAAVAEVLNTSDLVRDVQDARSFGRSLFEIIWQYRFVYRDLNHLLANNHRVETHMRALLVHQQSAWQEILSRLGRGGVLRVEAGEAETLNTSLVLLVLYWLSYEYVCEPRQALEPGNGPAAVARGTQQLMDMLRPYLKTRERRALAAELQPGSDDGAVAADPGQSALGPVAAASGRQTPRWPSMKR